MKKLISLVAIAVALSFVPVSVGWAAPGKTTAQQQEKEHPKKTVKKPDSQKQAVKARAHTRSHVKNSGHYTKSKDKATVRTPANHPRSKIKNDSQHARKVADEKIKPPENRDRHLQKHASRDVHKIQPRTDHHGTPPHKGIHRHDTHQHWPNNDSWHRRFRDWSWFGTHRAHNFDTRYGRHGRPLYISYEPLENDYLYLLEARYGGCHHRERHDYHGSYGWCYYWFSGGNVIALFAGDDGYYRTFIWQRDDVEHQAVALGILTPDLQLVYSRYDGAMPPDLAAGYARDVLWATVDDETEM